MHVAVRALKAQREAVQRNSPEVSGLSWLRLPSRPRRPPAPTQETHTQVELR